MEERCLTEVLELHRFFVDWFTARLPATREAFARFERVLAPGFQMVSPSGALVPRDALVSGLHAMHGTRPGVRIWIEDMRGRALDAGATLVLVTYKELQEERDGARTSRSSSALFAAHPDAPNQVIWEHVHETWIDGPARAGW